MFSKLNSTKYPPSKKPLMIYDGKCGFCKYWVIKWKKISGLGVDYKPYQEVADDFKDIEKKHFQEAVRFITTDGKIYNGPGAAYVTYFNQNKVKYLHELYQKNSWFTKISDVGYQWVADNRGFMSKVSVRLFGKNPANPKPYWKYYVIGILLFILSVYLLLTNI